MTVVFDAEALLAFSFDEQGAAEVERWLARVYDGDHDGYASTITLAEFRSVAAREASREQADAHIDALLDMGVTAYSTDEVWKSASELKITYGSSLGNAYAVATAAALDSHDDRTVTLLVGTDDDYDVFETEAKFNHLVERFRDDSG